MHWNDLNMKKNGAYGVLKSYCQSKLANILFTKELAKKLQGTSVAVYAVDPGIIHTEFNRYFLPEVYPPIVCSIVAAMEVCLFNVAEDGAQTTIHCAVDEQVAHQTGGCREIEPSNYGCSICDKIVGYVCRNGIFIGIYLLRRKLKGRRCTSNVKLHDKTVIVTGANIGIGKETARNFFKRGARVILACRNIEKATQAAQNIKSSPNSEGTVIVRRLDLSNFNSIREFATEILATEARINILVNNAGIVVAKSMTDDGFDMTFQTNHLGPFLLTNLLLEKIKASAPSRIVNVSSSGHQWGEMHWNDLNLNKEGAFGKWKAYSQSKLANILFTKELAKRLEGTGVTTYTLHPGVVNTGVNRYNLVPRIFHGLVFLMEKFFFRSSEEGAQTTIHCAVCEKVKNQSGLYYDDCRKKKLGRHAMDETAAKKLWVMIILIGLLYLRRWNRGPRCTSKARLDGKTVIVTGSNIGIGKETARARVIMACRNMERAAEAARDIESTPNCKGTVTIRHLNLANFNSVIDFAKEILATETRIDILVNNAGLLAGKSMTDDGFDMVFQSNHLGHFLLTNLLLDKIKNSVPSRIVNVSSGTGVNVYTLHPGAVHTGFNRHNSDYMPAIFRVLVSAAEILLFKDAKRGAQTTIHCAVCEKSANQTGLYYDNCKPSKPKRHARDEAASKMLWDMSAEMVKLEKVNAETAFSHL
uniref:Uncharacterized protein n=1 Tax=Strigamia maritima TaxID=126957 RepID=T1J5Y7_STRMM